MATRVRLEEAGKQAAERTPAPGTEVKIAIDLSRSKWVYCVRWEGQEQRRLTTPGAPTHVAALVAQDPGCSVPLAFEACGFGDEIAWWAAAQQIGVTVIAPSRLERAPGRQVKTDRLDVGTTARKLEQGALKGDLRAFAHRSRAAAGGAHLRAGAQGAQAGPAPGLGTLVSASRPALGASSVARGPGRRPVRDRALCQIASSYCLCARRMARCVHIASSRGMSSLIGSGMARTRA